jgi:hypothetical protein
MAKEYRAQRRTLLTEMELARLPETQAFIDEYHQACLILNNNRTQVIDLEKRIHQLQQRINNKQLQLEDAKEPMRTRIVNEITDLESKRIEAETHPVYQDSSRLTELVRRAEHIINNRIEDSIPIAPERRKFTMPCPEPQCRGFLSSQYKCGVCSVRICAHCHEKSHDDKCDPQKVETVQYIKQQSKPCPKCGARISKIDGCDQMWCIGCHTAFSWTSGLVQTGALHNPEYFRWMREHGHEDKLKQQVPCEHIDFRHIRAVFSDWTEIRTIQDWLGQDLIWYDEPSELQFWQNSIRLVHDARAWFTMHPILTNIDLRIRYLRNETSRDDLERTILFRERMNSRVVFVRDLVDLLSRVQQDIAGRLVRLMWYEDPTCMRQELVHLFEYFNEQTQLFSSHMGLKMPIIEYEYNLPVPLALDFMRK